jgi:hypothetical protein
MHWYGLSVSAVVMRSGSTDCYLLTAEVIRSGSTACYSYLLTAEVIRSGSTACYLLHARFWLAYSPTMKRQECISAKRWYRLPTYCMAAYPGRHVFSNVWDLSINRNLRTQLMSVLVLLCTSYTTCFGPYWWPSSGGFCNTKIFEGSYCMRQRINTLKFITETIRMYTPRNFTT